jgi:hypothetical protein
MGIEPDFNREAGIDALRTWMDFWEVSGKRRVDIHRYVYSGGDPEKMVPRDESVSVIQSVPAIFTGIDPEPDLGKPGAYDSGYLELELIDRIRDTDRIVIGGVEFAVKSVVRKDMGNFDVWIVKTRKI